MSDVTCYEHPIIESSELAPLLSGVRQLAPHNKRRVVHHPVGIHNQAREAGTDSLPAYEAYLQGTYFLARYTASAFPAAERNFERAIDLDPDYREAILNYGRLLDESGRLDQAERVYADLLDEDPENPRIVILKRPEDRCFPETTGSKLVRRILFVHKPR